MAVSWHAVFDDALRAADVIAVWVTVERLLGRPPTRAEQSAARRAANRYAAASNVRIVRVPAPVGGRGPRRVLLLARADADLDDTDRLLDVATRRPTRRRHQGQGTRNVGQRAENLAATVTRAAKTARQLSASQLEPGHAAALAEEIATALPELVTLQRRLRLRAEGTVSGGRSSRQSTAESDPAPGDLGASRVGAVSGRPRRVRWLT